MTAALPKAASADLFERVKDAVDLHDLAGRLGLEREGGKGNYRSPHHPDKNPSLSIFQKNGQWGWKDHSTGEAGSCIDLVMYVRPEVGPAGEAARQLAEWYGIAALQKPATKPQQRSIPEFIADRALAEPEPAVAYLASRRIDEAVVRAAIRQRTVGWNTWTNDKAPPGEFGHGGPAAVFVVRSLADRAIVAVDMRYADPALNGNVKTQCQGQKDGHPWTSDLQRLAKAHTVYVVESPINALSIECCPLPAGTAVLALRGTGNADKIDIAFLKGKRVIIALDHADPVNERTNRRPGLDAAWRLLDRLTSADIAARLVDMQDWEEGEDINDVLQAQGPEELWRRLRKLDHWLIPGMPGGGEPGSLAGRRRVFLPEQDFKVYWRFRTLDDFTQYVVDFKEDDDGKRRETLGDVCSFRVASLSRLRIQGHIATINGSADTQPETVFAISAQVPRHGPTLVRHVLADKTLYRLEEHRDVFGAIYKPQQYHRMLNMLERTADIGAREAVNFVGLAWRGGAMAAL